MSLIGLWAARHHSDTRRAVTLWHLVESEVSDRVVTRCGREMFDRNTNGELIYATDAAATGQRCHFCDTREVST